jgi:ubiquinone/menaquinone biosynthesis C-methylase UbiE
MTLQRNVFLSGEGDAWFQRNRRESPLAIPADDPLLPALLELPLEAGRKTHAAEVGCGQGLRLQALSTQKGWAVSGVDPSAKAVAAAGQLGVSAQVGTAEHLPFADQSIDLLIFGFCLYLCDRVDLFQIAAEAHRVLKPDSWLAILDFWAPHQRTNPYHHKEGVLSFKGDMPAMFLWHPAYVVTDHKLRHHSTHDYTDSYDEWVAVTVLRRSDANKS